MAVNKMMLATLGIVALFAFGAYAVMATNGNNDAPAVDVDRTYNAGAPIASPLAEVPAAKAAGDMKTIIGDMSPVQTAVPAAKKLCALGASPSAATPVIKTIEDAKTCYYGKFAKAVSVLEANGVPEADIVKFVDALAKEKESGVEINGMTPIWRVVTMEDAKFAYQTYKDCVEVSTSPYLVILTCVNLDLNGWRSLKDDVVVTPY